MKSKVLLPVDELDTFDLKLKGFKVYKIETSKDPLPSYNRKDFFKICIVVGKCRIYYSDHDIDIIGTNLFFGNPNIPYSFELLSDKIVGYACLFTEEFLKPHYRSESFVESPLFKMGSMPILALNKSQSKLISSLFDKMLLEQSTSYLYKNDVVRNYINLIIHEALKIQPAPSIFNQKNAAQRLATSFLELLERQFPIESIDHPLKLRTAQDYANELTVHVNHLNRSVREVTGRSTSTHIANRIIVEAKALLQHTNWGIAEVAYALGFEYPSYFNIYYKRITGMSPKVSRKST